MIQGRAICKGTSGNGCQTLGKFHSGQVIATIKHISSGWHTFFNCGGDKPIAVGECSIADGSNALWNGDVRQSREMKKGIIADAGYRDVVQPCGYGDVVGASVF